MVGPRFEDGIKTTTTTKTVVYKKLQEGFGRQCNQLVTIAAGLFLGRTRRVYSGDQV